MPSDFPVDSPFEHSKLWQDIFHSEQCGREYANAYVHLREPRFMEYLSMQRARDMIEETYFVGAKPHQRIYWYKIGQKPLESDV